MKQLIFRCSVVAWILAAVIIMPKRKLIPLAQGLAAKPQRRIAVVGGGASGVFASIAAAAERNVDVQVLEASSKTLTKVKISGGGRCNVLHDTSKPVTDLLAGYPRGNKELNGLLHRRFSPTQAQQWFEERGVQLKTEGDGRMFPVTDSSQTVVDALLGAARNQVSIRTRCQVESIQRVQDDEDGRVFHVGIAEKQNGQKVKTNERFHAVVLATGSVGAGYRIAEALGHTIVPTVPSLFTLNCKFAVQPGGILFGLSGVSVPNAQVSFCVPKSKASSKNRRKRQLLQQTGPLLITHHGLSGPAPLRLSAFGAREFATHTYRGHLLVNWAPDLATTTDELAELLWRATTAHPKKTIATNFPISAMMPRRLWAALAAEAGVEPETAWGSVNKKTVRKLATQIRECSLEMTGKGTFKEEFVTAGGVSLKEIDMTSMESKICPGLYFCGEVIDVDGVTGGFNFMNAWATGYVAGHAAGASTHS